MAGQSKPTPIDECKRAGTHMIRCTADGYCKVCFDDDGTVPLYDAAVPQSGQREE